MESMLKANRVFLPCLTQKTAEYPTVLSVAENFQQQLLALGHHVLFVFTRANEIELRCTVCDVVVTVNKGNYKSERKQFPVCNAHPVVGTQEECVAKALQVLTSKGHRPEVAKGDQPGYSIITCTTCKQITMVLSPKDTVEQAALYANRWCDCKVEAALSASAVAVDAFKKFGHTPHVVADDKQFEIRCTGCGRAYSKIKLDYSKDYTLSILHDLSICIIMEAAVVAFNGKKHNIKVSGNVVACKDCAAEYIVHNYAQPLAVIDYARERFRHEGHTPFFSTDTEKNVTIGCVKCSNFVLALKVFNTADKVKEAGIPKCGPVCPVLIERSKHRTESFAAAVTLLEAKGHTVKVDCHDASVDVFTCRYCGLHYEINDSWSVFEVHKYIGNLSNCANKVSEREQGGHQQYTQSSHFDSSLIDAWLKVAHEIGDMAHRCSEILYSPENRIWDAKTMSWLKYENKALVSTTPPEHAFDRLYELMREGTGHGHRSGIVMLREFLAMLDEKHLVARAEEVSLLLAHMESMFPKRV